MKKRHSAEQIVGKLRQADVEQGKGTHVPEVCRQLGTSEQTCYRWRQKYGGMAPGVAKQLKELEKENARLKPLVADQAWTCRYSRRLPAQTGEPRAEEEDGGEHQRQATG